MASQRAVEFPKIDLHRHWDGDLRYETVKYLADKEHVKMPASDPKEWRAWLDNLRDQGLSNLFQEGFGFVTGLLQTKENITYAAYEEVRQLAEDNIIYSELRIAPEYHTGMNEYYGHKKPKQRLDYPEILGALFKGLQRGEKDFGVKTRVIPCINRESEPEQGLVIAKKIIDCKNRYGFGIVGMDLVCDEWNYAPERHTQAFDYVYRQGCSFEIHAGEFGQDNYINMWRALHMKADRLGHAREISRSHLVDYVAGKRIGITMCPLSNLYCELIKNLRELHIGVLLEKDVLVSINTDDPAMFGFTLSDVVDRLIEEQEVSWEDIAKLQLNAAAISFLPEIEQKQLRLKLNRALLKIRSL